ncbi:hypothetical protein QO002_001792 [Pararhizobium capsulatum DSM 1112]|uniref:Uncharacterized protein n=1 Tax=Pararhizobium capsulatum DSM 1112 TaxID=1121113 RepID=A0ABU0BN27_9HYPH|nr:hypothetical protein [Pararhizobium capsulatum]MDQ0319654.1 hypothetical protein [Pararhizobium capsulatum DSM 1112]
MYKGMIRKTLRAALVLFLLPIMSNAEDLPLTKDYAGNYLCKMTAQAGIHFDETAGKWISATFNVEDSAYIVNVIDTGQQSTKQFTGWNARIYNITVKTFSGTGTAYPCFNVMAPADERNNISTANGYAECFFSQWKYSFDFETLKMQVMFDGGYMDNELNTDTPAVSVGKCQRID